MSIKYAKKILFYLPLKCGHLLNDLTHSKLEYEECIRIFKFLANLFFNLSEILPLKEKEANPKFRFELK